MYKPFFLTRSELYIYFLFKKKIFFIFYIMFFMFVFLFSKL